MWCGVVGQNEVENHNDAVDLLDMALDDDAVKLKIGEVFIDVEGEEAESAVKKKRKAAKDQLAALQKEVNIYINFNKLPLALCLVWR